MQMIPRVLPVKRRGVKPAFLCKRGSHLRAASNGRPCMAHPFEAAPTPHTPWEGQRGLRGSSSAHPRRASGSEVAGSVRERVAIYLSIYL